MMHVILAATFATFGYLVAIDRPLAAAIAFAAGYASYAYLKRRSDGAFEDERSYAIGEKASRFTLIAFTLSFGVLVTMSKCLGVIGIPEEIVRVLSMSVGLLLLLYIAGYAYYSWRLS